MKKEIDFEIDIVIPWVDGSDPEWLKSKNIYSGKELSDAEIDYQVRQFRDWDNLQFLFRGIEEFMPWVRKVHFITCGQKPEWLNENYAKINWVKHSDYIPSEYLPTFSANPIELNIHRIDSLAEHFIYFNDDFFVLQPSKKGDFFSPKGLPKDQAVMFRISTVSYGDVFGHIQLNDIGVINQNFNRSDVLKQHWRKLFSPKNGLLAPILSATFLPTNHFPGFMINHMPQAFLKSTFEEVWSKEYNILDTVCKNKFRTVNDVNQYLMREWQFATGRFEPSNILNKSGYFSIFPEQLGGLIGTISNQKKKLICINDAKVEDFEETKKSIQEAFEKILPHKSGFEL
ncbi:MAG: stealth family protein [Candidatus Saccharibacteria bacterium]|nr:stealth family protein [Candidatus Saccharibacteria bacterium]